MSTYQPGSKIHTILERLSESDASFLDISDVIKMAHRKFRRDGLWHKIGCLLRDELIGGGRQRYYLLPAGRNLLQALRAGQPASVFTPAMRLGTQLSQ